ncbi:LysR family transcriptional regulator [Teichococcus vastitatis]|uniref:LysR family transcriptional regulator n=1 Tax=Teichococcus vastitatis TaxID=2307076 RepID=UPI000E74EF83|nr:LysR family transcriptional regulator [Pseudoroseomonas vastitatis]
MQPLRLDSLEAFAAIVRCGGFRAAAAERGVSSSALSQTVASLEAALGIRLLNRTTRSVFPTEAGERLLERLAPALNEIRHAVADLDQLRENPSGTVRINAPGPAADHLLCPLAFSFMRAYPEVRIEIVSDAAIIDIVERGFDAGVRFGQQIEKDMIAVPLGPPLRYAIVASPGYLERRGTPATPHDLVRHECIRRRFPGGTFALWRFEKDGEAFEVTPAGRLTLGSAHQEMQAAVAGQGIAHVFEDYVGDRVERGDLVEVLREWSPKLPGWFLYYPNRRHTGAAMRAFLDHLRSFAWRVDAAAEVSRRP